MMMMMMISLRFFILRSQSNDRSPDDSWGTFSDGGWGGGQLWNWAASIFVIRAFLFPCHFLKKCPGNVAGAMWFSGEMKLEEMTD